MQALRLTLRQLQVFAAVARAGTTTAAGEVVGLSQSATSAALKELERMLDTPLFDRIGKRLQLNGSGRTLLPHALALLDGATSLERTVRGDQDRPDMLRLGASTTIGNYVLPRWLSQHWAPWYAAQPPEWHARLKIGNTADICRAVADFSLDVGLIEGPCHDPVLQAHPWLRDELLIVASPRLARRLQPGGGAVPAVSVRVLRQQVWLLREAGSGTRVATDLELLPHLHAYRRSIELGNSEAIKHAAAEGLGLACLSEWVVGDLIESGRLARLATTLPRILRPCYLVLHRHKQATGALKRLTASLMQASV